MKAAAREKACSVRDSIPAGQRKEKSSKIVDMLLSMPQVKDAKTVMTYLSFKSEVESVSLTKTLLSQGKRVVVPVSDFQEAVIIPGEIHSIEDDVVPNELGILEPPRDRIKPVALDDIDLVIVPGLCFDRSGNRIGYGKGFYDKFLSNLPKKPVVIALAFSEQVIENLPVHDHDHKMDFIVTDEGVVECEKA